MLNDLARQPSSKAPLVVNGMRLQMWWSERPRSRALRNIRESLTAFGPPTDGVSDEAIEQAVARLGEGCRAGGASMADVQASLEKIPRVIGSVHGA